MNARIPTRPGLLRLAAATAFLSSLLAAPAQASFLYTFSFDALTAGAAGPAVSAASIVFSTDNIAVEGGFLDYVSGNLNGCIPTEGGIEYRPGTGGARGGFGTLADGLSCGDGTGASVDGLFFRPDTDPAGVGSFTSAATAGRFFVGEMFSGAFRYTSGTLTIAATGANGVPEPTTLALVGLSLAGLWMWRRRG